MPGKQKAISSSFRSQFSCHRWPSWILGATCKLNVALAYLSLLCRLHCITAQPRTRIAATDFELTSHAILPPHCTLLAKSRFTPGKRHLRNQKGFYSEDGQYWESFKRPSRRVEAWFRRGSIQKQPREYIIKESRPSLCFASVSSWCSKGPPAAAACFYV